MDCLYKYTVFRAKKSEIRPIRPIRPIPNVDAHTIGIVFASSKPIRIDSCFDDVWIKRLRLNGARLNYWIYWWTIEFIQFNFSIAHWWRKDGCQRVYELGLDQLLFPINLTSFSALQLVHFFQNCHFLIFPYYYYCLLVKNFYLFVIIQYFSLIYIYIYSDHSMIVIPSCFELLCTFIHVCISY